MRAVRGNIRVLNMGHIRDGKVHIPEKGSLHIMPPGLLLEKYDLLFNRTNSPDLVGKVGLFSGDASDEVTFASYLVRLRGRSEHNPFWLNYLLNSPIVLELCKKPSFSQLAPGKPQLDALWANDTSCSFHTC